MKRTRRRTVRILDRIPLIRLLLLPTIRPKLIVSGGAELVLEGFPRSGNTFLASLMRQAAPDLNFSHHTHLIANLERAKREKLPAVVLFRNPLDSVSSLVVKNPQVYKPSECLSDYIAYYRSAKKLLPSAIFIHSDELFSNPLEVLGKINRETGLSIESTQKVLKPEGLAKNSTLDKNQLERARSQVTAERVLKDEADVVFRSLIQTPEEKS